MSRIIVKNLPKQIKEDRVKNIFGAKGSITDCALKYTKDGVFRQFAFIGYKTEQQAKDAISYFNKSFIDTSRIQVEMALDLGDSKKPRAWSKYSADSSAFKRVQKKAEQKSNTDKELSASSGKNADSDDKSTDGRKNKKKIDDSQEKKKKKQEHREKKMKELLGDLHDDPQFKEFMSVHEGRSQKAVWKDDETVVGKSATKDNEQVKMVEKMDCEDESDASEAEPTDKIEKSPSPKKAVSDTEYLKSKVKISAGLLASESEESESESSDSSSSSSEEELDTRPLSRQKPEQDGNLSSSSSESDSDDDDDDDDDQYNKKGNKVEPKTSDSMEKSDSGFMIKMRGVPTNVTEKSIHEFFLPIPIRKVHIPRNAKGKKTFCVAAVEVSSGDIDQAMRRNKNFIGTKKIFLHKSKIEQEAEIHEKPRPWEFKKADEEEQEPVGESGRLYVRNLAYCCTEEDLESLFGKYGPLTEAHLPIDSFTKKKKGFAFVTYMMPEHAVQACTKLDGTAFQGRMLHILPAKPKKEEEEITDDLSFKKKKKAQLKASAGSSHNWNALFLGANAVADVMAEKYGMTKGNILDAEQKQSLGVRMALGETQVVAETRDFLVEQGVSLDAFSQPAAERSKTVIMVKNLPAGTKAGTLRQLFEKHGTLGRVVLPPSGVTALVEYLEPTEARKGFRCLAYTKFEHVPLYLEWAPLEVFAKPAKQGEAEKSQDAPPEAEQDDESSSEEEEEEGDGPQESGTTVFVKNLNFDSKEDDLKKLFSQCGKIAAVTIAKKKDMKNPGQMLSMGYGFVEYRKKQSAEKALKTLQHSKLDDHQLELKLSNRVTVQKQPSVRKKQDPKKKQRSSKILVRNIPFEAKVREVKELFTVFGEVKSVRLPKKMSGTGTHRGFGFVDFMSKQDAKRAFNALCHSTHLYGRRLVVEWADSEETVDQLRKKTADHYHDEPASKKLKKSALLEDLGMT